MKTLFVTGIAMAALLVPAAAADMPLKAPLPMAPVYSWTGFYFGGNVGYGWGNNDAITFSGDPNTAAAIARGQVASSLGGNPQGMLGGLQIGYNYQTGAFVWGIEADFQMSAIGANSAVSTAIPGFFPVTTSGSQDLLRFGTVRGRLGYTVWPSLLLYGTGGLAYGSGEVSSFINTTPGCPGFCGGLTTTTQLTGWTAGVGAEYMFTPNWSGKLEYLYYDLGSISQQYGDIFGRFPGTSGATSTAFKGDIVRIGMNYKFW
jgi:outer membrane immunogenic protein